MKNISAYLRIAAGCSLVLFAMEARAQLEGTLFTKPDEREYLDYLRQERMRATAAEDFNIEDVAIPEIPDEVVVAATTGPVEYNFGGVMARRDGIRVWLNGRLLAEAELPEGFSIVENGRSFSLRIVQDGQTFMLLPGQTVDVTGGTIIENFQQPPPPAETTAAPQAETAIDPALPEAATAEAAPAIEDASGETAASGEILASQDSDIDTDALSAAASRLDDSEVDALFEILENRRLERDTLAGPDEEPNGDDR